MKEFDGVLIGAIFTCLAVFGGALVNKYNSTKNKKYLAAAIGLFVIALAVPCYLAIHFRWNSDLLSISDSNTPDTVVVNEETAESTIPDKPYEVDESEELIESTIPDKPDGAIENEGGANNGKIAATVQLDHGTANGCPRFNEPAPYIYADQKMFEITWEQFKDHSAYLVYVYSRDGDTANEIRKERVTGTKYVLDMSIFKAGKKYSVSVATIREDGEGQNFSPPIYINMLP